MFDDAIALLKGFWTTVKYTARPAVTKVEIDPEALFPDLNRANQLWESTK